LHPTTGTATLGREGFSIHGGSYPGSAGCIDLTTQMSPFVGAFRAYGSDMNLEVEYGK